jgi:cyclic pyranopterin phosphate synthase
MPKEGIPYEPKAHLLSYEEITRLLGVLGNMGFRKVRFTGGEPFLRKDFMQLLENTTAIPAFQSIHITSNGTLLQRHIPRLLELGITNINLSLDTLDPDRFQKITRRKDYDTVIETLHRLMEQGFKVKINAVIMSGINNQDIIPLTMLAKNHPVSVRFIEEMPFNGGYKQNSNRYNAQQILKDLNDHFPALTKIKTNHGDTANVYNVPGYTGNIGIIAAFTRTFCNTCNRLRISSKGDIKTCLYDGGVFNIKDYMRSGVTDIELGQKFQQLIKLKPKNGFVAEKLRDESAQVLESMSTIGG